MKLTIKSKKTLFKIAFTSLIGFGSMIAIAAIPYETEFTFYDKNGNEVGSRIHACNGNIYTAGITTVNYTISRVSCDFF